MLPIFPMLDILVGSCLGLAQGMRHALEPDHVAAVSALLSRGPSARAAVPAALAWGAGHGLTLLTVGGVLCSLRLELPTHIADGFELVAALMLVVLGARALFSAGELAAPTGAGQHAHTRPDTRWLLRPLGVGLVHGLAGSGALTVVALAHAHSLTGTLAFMGLYALGACCGMALLAGLARRPLAHLTRERSRGLMLPRLLSLVSLLVGLAWGAPIALRLWS